MLRINYKYLPPHQSTPIVHLQHTENGLMIVDICVKGWMVKRCFVLLLLLFSIKTHAIHAHDERGEIDKRKFNV